MSIRKADQFDWEEVRAKVVAFNEQYFPVPVDEEKLHTWFTRHLETGVVFLSDNGIMSALYIEDPVRPWAVLAETAWYDTGLSGYRLLVKLIKYARSMEVDEVRMTTLNTSPASASRLLERMGFEEIERSHRLTL